TLAYCSSYVGSSNIPAIELAERLAKIAYPRLNMTFFTSGGAESTESAFKTARFYWKVKGKPEKIKIIAREHAYHGVTLAAMSATGMTPYWSMFEPRVPGFVHCATPYSYRFQGARPGESVGQAAARSLEETILREGADTVAAFIAEPVQGAGGVIPAPDDYFPLIREICSRHQVLFIADEVITGFGRTGRRFALQRWGVEPDIMAFAKAITSGYVPLGGIMISDEIKDAILSAPPEKRWMHAFTYSGHPTSCAVALRNLDIIDREGLIENADRMGARLINGLKGLSSLPMVGDVRGLGLMAAVELVKDKESKAPFDAKLNVGGRVHKAAIQRGLFSRVRGDSFLLAPPLIIKEEQVDQIVNILGEAIQEVAKEVV
ncbi:MAG: aspartate aminotransferase family protein, partial [candidate division NC10 bacterium]|nr:aspartate aminotransferase family protein [candidate division NC10 bacterium]